MALPNGLPAPAVRQVGQTHCCEAPLMGRQRRAAQAPQKQGATRGRLSGPAVETDCLAGTNLPLRQPQESRLSYPKPNARTSGAVAGAFAMPPVHSKCSTMLHCSSSCQSLQPVSELAGGARSSISEAPRVPGEGAHAAAA